MDIELARTFLEIVGAGSFAGAAERLNVTQTTVSARVRTLEERFNCRLFVRNKAGARLTAAGERFLRHAPTLIQMWERARHQVAVPDGRRAVVALGCEPALWNPLLLDLLLWLRDGAPEVAWRAQVGLTDDLIARIGDGVLDLAIVYAPRFQGGLKVELITEDELVMVTTEPAGGPPDPGRYVFVDWGPDFTARHHMTFPELANTGAYVGLGPVGLSFILAGGGAGYFRRRLVGPHLASGRLHLVDGAPRFAYPAYAVHAEHGDDALIGIALAGLRAIAAHGASDVAKAAPLA